MKDTRPPDLTRFAWLSIAAAVLTIALKTVAWRLTASVGLLSDAVESLVNLVAAAVTLWMLRISARPADEDHTYGYTKAEYFASGAEGAMIVLAAVAIGWTAVGRLIRPRAIEQAGLGLAVSTFASAINFTVSRALAHAGRKHGSIALEADAHHLMTDVWTSAGVLVAVAMVALTGWQPLDPIIALVVAANIVRVGFRLVRRSALGLLDASLPLAEQAALNAVLDRYRSDSVKFHAIRTRQAASRRFVSMHVLVPGDWTVLRGHELVERIELDIHAALHPVNVVSHLEPLEHPASYEDEGLDRAAKSGD